MDLTITGIGEYCEYLGLKEYELNNCIWVYLDNSDLTYGYKMTGYVVEAEGCEHLTVVDKLENAYHFTTSAYLWWQYRIILSRENTTPGIIFYPTLDAFYPAWYPLAKD